MARQRITEKMLQVQVDYLNKITGNNPAPWTRAADGKLRANIGNYHIYHAYGGVALHQMTNEGGGVRTPLSSHIMPKRELFDQIRAFIDGIEVGQQVAS